MLQYNRKFLFKKLIFQIVWKFIDSYHMYISIFQDVFNVLGVKNNIQVYMTGENFLLSCCLVFL